MWQLFYIRALEIHEEYRREAERERLARPESGPREESRPGGVVADLRRAGASAAIWVARRLHPGTRRNRRHAGQASIPSVTR